MTGLQTASSKRVEARSGTCRPPGRTRTVLAHAACSRAACQSHGYLLTMRESNTQRHIDHVTLNMTDEGAARSFYDATLAELGLTPSVDSFGRVEYLRDG